MRQSAVPRPMSWLYARTLHHIDRIVFRRTRGRETFTSWVTGLRVVMLTTTGAKSGSPRTLPVIGIPVDDRLVVIASNYGQRHNPAWYHNLQAYPRASVFVDGASRDVVARELMGDERECWYARGIGIYPGWRQYRKRAEPRQIPVVELHPALRDDNSTEP
jgi:deazaflavin-dependent oxidoreductase (nitroreductase family)